ncbi:MAG: hypothetical protein ACD_64C00066G0002 [uncultured bacterium]|mgnify:CR=1 FL=1|nr:MAG: hypothetical protein ACD_64C00066G0002 [uncultured bacterium]
MLIVRESISPKELKKMAEKMYGGLVKAVVDIEKNIMAIDAELPADEEALLLDQGSKQENLWGINIYPDNLETEDWLEFDSMINLRPSQGNKSRSVENKNIQQKITSIVKKLIK